MFIIPKKLEKGDKIRIIAPSMSMAIISQSVRNIAKQRLEKSGFKITFSKNIEEKDEFGSSSIQPRIIDIHEAFLDKNVKAILTAIGGFNSNQLLKYLDYNIIKLNPKIFCGYSDITALQNAIYTKTGLVTYSGPYFSTFGMLKGIDYTLDYFKKCLIEEIPFNINPSKTWSDDLWYKNQKKRKFIKNKGCLIINKGEAEGIIIGGNLCSLNLLQGTEFMPNLKNVILFIEDDGESRPQIFDRDLQSLIHLPNFYGVKALIIGRFQKKSKIKDNLLTKIIKNKKELKDIPAVANVNFGHTTPQITFPIGGKARIFIGKNKVELKILKH